MCQFLRMSCLLLFFTQHLSDSITLWPTCIKKKRDFLFLTSVQGDNKSVWHILCLPSGGVIHARRHEINLFSPVYILIFGSALFVTLLVSALFPVDRRDSVTTQIRPQHPRSSFTLHCSFPCSSSPSLPFVGLSHC